MITFRSAALSDLGKVRRQNEDRVLHDRALRIFGVADGVGGLPGGAEAAQRAVDEVVAAFRRVQQKQEPDFPAIVAQVNRSVRELGSTLSPTLGLGCTLTFGQMREASFVIAHVGDSRCYCCVKGDLAQLTEDHSVENEARLRRARGEVVYYSEADRNALTRCIGQPGTPKVDLIRRPVAPGERYLFCTDGVSRVVRPAELQEILSAPLEPDATLHEIVARALDRGGPDNASGVVVFVDEV